MSGKKSLREIIGQKNAAPPPQGSGIVITKASEIEAEKAKIKAVLTSTATVPKPYPPTPQGRELGDMEPRGEQIPMEWPEGNQQSSRDWFTALHSLDASLCIVIEPEGTHAWIALDQATQVTPSLPPLLLFRLPLSNRKTQNNPF